MDDSSTSSDVSLRVADTVEFTLEDTLEMLKELKLARDETLERMYDVQVNNHLFAPLNSPANVLEEQQQLRVSFMNEISNDTPDEYPIPNTVDMYTNLITELTEEIEHVQERIGNATDTLKRKEEDISRLKEKNEGFERMKEACLTANKIIASKTYEQEIRITSEIFHEIRDELREVVTSIFPNGDNVKDFLATLSVAYFTRGDDVYIDLAPEDTDVANFLHEAGLLVYHPYDENKVRLVDLYSILPYLFLTFFGNAFSSCIKIILPYFQTQLYP